VCARRLGSRGIAAFGAGSSAASAGSVEPLPDPTTISAAAATIAAAMGITRRSESIDPAASVILVGQARRRVIFDYRQTVDERQLARKAQIAELLLNASRQLGETLEPERVYARFHELLGELVPHDGLVVSSYDERDDLIHCEFAWVEGTVVDPTTLPPLPLNREGGGMQSRVIVSGESFVFNDVADRVHEPGGSYYNVDREGTVQKVPESGPAGTTAALMVPVKQEGRVVGVVQVMRDTGAYSGDELELAEGLVGQMAAAVRNARLQKEHWRLEAAEAAARAVAAEREQAAQVLDAVGEGIILVDSEGVIQFWNRAAEVVTGVAAAEATGRHAANVILGWTTLAERIPVTEKGAPGSVALPVAIGDRDLWLSFNAVRGANGVVYTFRDVTFERRLEEVRSDFVATISHELRTPMAGIYGAAQTLLHRDAELSRERRLQLLDVIASQASRLTQITEAVLLTSRLERDELPIESRRVDIKRLVRSTVDAVGEHVPESSVRLELPEEVRAASGDPDRIQQVLVNLLDNAIKYGGGRVTVRVENENGFVRISVADEGPGISAGDQQRVFEKFYRGSPQQAHGPGGTGLGLYISRELVRRMDGQLSVSSPPGGGATFVLELPRA
jgi:two-component system, OmpR family, phosphate regulon sensor histidine kinase PhoR